MQEKNEETISKESLSEELTKLRAKYKEIKEKLEWAEDDMEEFFIQEEMDKCASTIRDLVKQIASLDNTEQLA